MGESPQTASPGLSVNLQVVMRKIAANGWDGPDGEGG